MEHLNQVAYLQPTSVKIITSKFDVSGAWGRRQIYLDMQVAAIYRHKNSDFKSDVFGLFAIDMCEKLVSGGIDIKVLNSDNIANKDCYLMPIGAHNKIIDGVNTLCLDVISCGDMSKYINGNVLINEILIKASIMDGSLIIKG